MRDVVTHYFVCSILWQIARETLSIQEMSSLVEKSRCILQPNFNILLLPAFVHTLHHCNISDIGAVIPGVGPLCPNVAQVRAT